MIELYLLLIFMIIAAIVAVSTKDLFFSVMAVGAVGLALSVAFLILKAPDLAITQLVMEIMVLIILVRATIRADIPSVGGIALISNILVGIFIIAFLAIAAVTIKDLPQFGQPIMKVSQDYLAHGAQQKYPANVVSLVSMEFRSFDTFGEAIVIFASVMGVLTVVRKLGKKKEEKERSSE